MLSLRHVHGFLRLIAFYYGQDGMIIGRLAFAVAVVSSLILLVSLTAGLVSASYPSPTPPPPDEMVTQTSVADLVALISLYKDTDGPNWNNNTNWLSETPVGEWYGVSTDSNGRVVVLILSGNGLSGTIPSELANLASLQTLQLDSNQLSGGIPSELGNLASLETLRLYQNQLSGGIPSELGNLANLRELNIGSNQLSGGIPSELGNLANLDALGLYQNQLSREIPSELGNLTNLRELWLFSNQLSGEIPSELGNLANLDALRLHQNQLSREIPSELGNLANLRELWLFSNQLSGGIPPELGALSNLVDLNLRVNQLTGKIPSELGNLADLVLLDLSWNQLTGKIPSELGNLANLEEVNLSENPLEGCIPRGLEGIGENDLHYLGLPFCRVPGPPTITALIVASDNSLVIVWVAPTRRPAVTAYDLRYTLTDADETVEGNWTVVEDVWTGSGALRYVLTGLASGRQYDVQVRAVNADGDGPWSATVTFFPDRAALVALYNATDGPNWEYNANWLSDAPLREWYGVGTDSGGRVVWLSLTNNGLNGTIPPNWAA